MIRRSDNHTATYVIMACWLPLVGSCDTNRFSGPGQSEPPILTNNTSLHSIPFGAIYVPQNFPDSTFEDVGSSFAKIKTLGSLICHNWTWQTGDAGLVNATIVSEEARARGFRLLLQFEPQVLGDISPPPGLGANSFQDELVQERYINDAVRLAELQPDWLVLVTEVNLMLRGAGQAEFEAYVDLYQRTYNAVKDVAPNTLVGVSYHHTLLSAERNFEIVNQMGPQDFIGLTTYPDALVLDGFIDGIFDFPDNFYKVYRQMFPDMPIAFTEVGFTTHKDLSQELQANYIVQLPEMMEGVEPIFISWAMLHDIPAFDVRFLTETQQANIARRFGVSAETLFERLNNMGLFETDGTPKRGYYTALSVFGGSADDASADDNALTDSSVP